jgi:excisionase family DNA binding protein
MNQMTIVQADQLDMMMEELKRLHRRLDAVELTPKPEWLTVIEYAKLIGKGERTVIRMIQSGKLEIKHTGGIRLIHVNLAA